MANPFVQTMNEARVDAQSLSEFMFKPASAMVSRRLAPPMNTLNYFLQYFNGISSIYTQDSGSVTVAGQTHKTIGQLEIDATNTVNAAIESVAIDANLVTDALIATTGGVNQLTLNHGVSDVATLKTITNPVQGMRVYVKGYHSNSVDGSGDFVWDESSTDTEVDGIVVKIPSINTGRFKRVIKDGVLNVLDVGAVRSGLVETHVAIRKALNYGITNNIAVYAPKGVYLLGGRVDPTLSNNKSLYFYGDGSGLTVFRERDGLTLELGRFNMSFYFLAANGVSFETLSITGMTVDKRGVASPINKDVDMRYLYEQAHCIGISTGWTGAKIKNLLIDDVVTTDKIGAGICLMAGYIDNAIVNNIHGTNYSHNGGQRGDFEFQSFVTNLVVSNSTGIYTQCEPDRTSVPPGVYLKATYNNCTYDTSEFSCLRGSPDAMTIKLFNHTASNRLNILCGKIIAEKSNFGVNSNVNEYWEGTSKGSVVDDCEITVAVDTVSNKTNPFYLRPSSLDIPAYLKIKNSRFIMGLGGTSTTTGLAISSSTYNNDSNADCTLEIDNVEFDPLFEGSVNAYANAKSVVIKNSRLSSRVGKDAIVIGGFETFYSNVTVENNNLDNVKGSYINIGADNQLWSLNVVGVMPFADFTISTSGVVNKVSAGSRINYKGAFTSKTIPTGAAWAGQIVNIEKPAFGTGHAFVCTTTSASSATFALISQAGMSSGVTSAAPTNLTLASAGLKYHDTTLGAIKTWSGTTWI